MIGSGVALTRFMFHNAEEAYRWAVAGSTFVVGFGKGAVV